MSWESYASSKNSSKTVCWSLRKLRQRPQDSGKTLPTATKIHLCPETAPKYLRTHTLHLELRQARLASIWDGPLGSGLSLSLYPQKSLRCDYCPSFLMHAESSSVCIPLREYELSYWHATRFHYCIDYILVVPRVFDITGRQIRAMSVEQSLSNESMQH